LNEKSSGWGGAVQGDSRPGRVEKESAADRGPADVILEADPPRRGQPSLGQCGFSSSESVMRPAGCSGTDHTGQHPPARVDAGGIRRSGGKRIRVWPALDLGQVQHQGRPPSRGAKAALEAASQERGGGIAGGVRGKGGGGKAGSFPRGARVDRAKAGRLATWVGGSRSRASARSFGQWNRPILAKRRLEVGREDRSRCPRCVDRAAVAPVLSASSAGLAGRSVLDPVHVGSGRGPLTGTCAVCRGGGLDVAPLDFREERPVGTRDELGLEAREPGDHGEPVSWGRLSTGDVSSGCSAGSLDGSPTPGWGHSERSLLWRWKGLLDGPEGLKRASRPRVPLERRLPPRLEPGARWRSSRRGPNGLAWRTRNTDPPRSGLGATCRQRSRVREDPRGPAGRGGWVEFALKERRRGEVGGPYLLVRVSRTGKTLLFQIPGEMCRASCQSSTTPRSQGGVGQAVLGQVHGMDQRPTLWFRGRGGG